MSIAPTNSLNISSIATSTGTGSGSTIKKVSVGGIKKADKDQKDQANAENDLNEKENTNNTAESRVSPETPLERLAKDPTSNRLTDFIKQMNEKGLPQNQNQAAAAPPPQQQNGMDPMLAAMMSAGKKEESSKPSPSKSSSGSGSKGASEAISKLKDENSKLRDFVKSEMSKINQKNDPRSQRLEDKLKETEQKITDPFERPKTEQKQNRNNPIAGIEIHDPEDKEQELIG
jgi:hypothetical protein